MKKNIISKKFETIFFTLLLLVFFLGFFTGWNFSDKSLTTAQINFQKTQLDLRSINEQVDFENVFNNNSCNKDLINSLSNSLYNSGLELENLEKNKKINTKYYNLLKQKHNINQVLFYSEYKKMNSKCNLSSNIILFFFDANNSDQAIKQGKELDKLVKKYDLIILPMDYKYTKSLDYFYNFYNIKDLPTLVINYNHKLNGFSDEKMIENYLSK